MEYRRIGSLDVSLVGLGGNNFGTDFFGAKCDEAQSARIIHAAIDAGITFIDTAEEYSIDSHIGSGRSEEIIGRALGSRRNDVVIATKFSTKDATAPDQRGRSRIVHAVESSLRRLGTDRIDLYQQHFPDPDVPIEEMLEALTRLVRDGKVREIGCCNFSGAMIDEALEASDELNLVRFASSQSQYNLLDDPAEEGVIEACVRSGLKLIPFFPLASGLLTGKYGRGGSAPAGSRFEADTVVNRYLTERQVSDQRHAKVAQFEAFARERGHTVLELAMSWLASHGIVGSIIAGASKPEQIAANVAATHWALTEDDLRELEAMRR